MKGYAALLLADGSEPIDPGYQRQPCDYEVRDEFAAVTSPLTFGPFEKGGYWITRGVVYDLPLGGRRLTPVLILTHAIVTGPSSVRTAAA